MTMFTVLITTFNRPKDLTNAIESVLKLDVAPGEIIVVNDGEPLSSEFVAHYINHNIRFYSTSGYQGPSAARNLGIKVATGKWICFLDDDDCFYTNRLSAVLPLVNKELDVIISEVTINYPTFDLRYSTTTHFRGHRELIIRNSIGGIPKLTIRASILKEILFNENLKAFEDYELNLRLSQARLKFGYTATPLVVCNYIVNKPSVSKSSSASLYNLYAIQKKFGLKKLSFFEQRRASSWRYDIVAQKMLLSNNIVGYFNLELRALVAYPSLKNLVKVLISGIGVRGIIKLRSMYK